MAAIAAFPSPLSGPAGLRAWARRAAPGVAAALLHVLAAWLLISLMRPAANDLPARQAISVALVSPSEPAPAPAEAPPEAVPAADAAPPVLAEPVPAQAAPEPGPAAVEAAREPAAQDGLAALADGVVLDAAGGAEVETALPTRASALRGLACARAFSGAPAPVGCEDAAEGFDFSRYAAGEGVERVESVVAARFNALAGLYAARLDPAMRRLPGQQGMEVVDNRRLGMSGADEMRDTLPALVPDPAFGD